MTQQPSMCMIKIAATDTHQIKCSNYMINDAVGCLNVHEVFCAVLSLWFGGRDSSWFVPKRSSFKLTWWSKTPVGRVCRSDKLLFNKLLHFPAFIAILLFCQTYKLLAWGPSIARCCCNPVVIWKKSNFVFYLFFCEGLKYFPTPTKEWGQGSFIVTFHIAINA